MKRKPKTSAAQLKANSVYEANKKAAGYEKKWLWLKPAWMDRVKKLIEELESYKD